MVFMCLLYMSFEKSVGKGEIAPNLVFMCLHYTSFKNTVRKGEIACYKQFLVFPQCFLLFLANFLSFSSNLEFLSAKSFSLEKSKICNLGKGYLFLI